MDTLDFCSPERSKVKVTYANRHKKRSGKDNSEDRASVSSEGSENGEGRSSGASVFNIPVKAHKRVDSFDLPGPEPRPKSNRSSSKDRTLADSSALRVISKSPVQSEQPLSAVASKLILANRVKNPLKTPEDDVGASEKTRAARTAEFERLAYFQNHPDVTEVEPHRVLCRSCEKWLNLHPVQKYSLAAWKAHKLLCYPSKPLKRPQHNYDKVAGINIDDGDASSAAPSVSASEASISASLLTGTRARLTAEERRRALEQDELTGEVRESEVFCQPCRKWVKLGSTTKYALQKWARHAERVHRRRPDVPSSRVQEAERKLQLVNDAQVKEFSANRVICRVCDLSVALSETVPYDLRNWQDHRDNCVLPVAEPISNAARPPPSTTSTETTFVTSLATSASPQSVSGQKRTREEDEGEKGSPAVRQRTESFVSSEKPAGFWALFWLPWQTFKRGFEEGLWSSSHTPTS